MRPLRIAIAGAGTAGLAAAAFLTRDGHDVHLFERFDEPRPLGAGLMLQPTGLACLACLGLDRSAIDAGAVVRGIDGRTVRGAHIFDVAYRELGPSLFGIGIHRGALFGLLYDEVRRLAVPITASVEMRASRCAPGGRLLLDAQGNGARPVRPGGRRHRAALAAARRRGRGQRQPPLSLWRPVGHRRDARRLAASGPAGAGLRRLPPDGRHPPRGPPTGRSAPPRRPVLEPARARPRRLARGRHRALARAGAGRLARGTAVRGPDPLRRRPDVRLLRRRHAARAPRRAHRLHRRRRTRDQPAARPRAPTSPSSMRPCSPTACASSRRSPRPLPPMPSRGARTRASTPSPAAGSRPSSSRTAALPRVVRDLTFPIAGKVPYVRREMVRTLSGMKTGLFTHLDPGQWHPDYALGTSALSSQPV